MFDQDPPVLAPDYTGTIALRDFTVAGDVSALQFQFVDGAVEVWQRERMDTVAGRPVSVFQPSWPASALDRSMALSRWGWDSPDVIWGDVIGGGAGGGNKQILLRIGPSNLPNVTVRRAGDDVQYSSHVVNIVLPGFGDTIVQDDDETPELARATARFYELFEDTYDAIAIVPQRGLLLPYSAVHRHVKSDVGGIGQDPVDLTAQFHSAGQLHSLELYPQFFATNSVSNHETAHQWGSYVDWTALNGLERAGHQPAYHEPLWANNAALNGAVLLGTRRVVGGDGNWHIEKSPAPMTYPPLMLYAMGLIPKEQVQDIVLFDNQGQFNPGAAVGPAVGTPVVGATRSATIFNIVGMLGERSGPVPTVWNRATIVVSRGALLSQREMNYWTFFAQRLEDPNKSGVVSFDGFGSLDLATNRAADLKTGIRPLGVAPIVQPLPVDFPEFGTTDVRGVTLNGTLKTLYTVGERARFAGRVSLPNASDFDRIAFRLFKDGGTAENALFVVNPIGGGGTFSVDTQPFEASQRGRYQLEMFLFPRGATSAGGRLQISTFTIN